MKYKVEGPMFLFEILKFCKKNKIYGVEKIKIIKYFLDTLMFALENDPKDPKTIERVGGEDILHLHEVPLRRIKCKLGLVVGLKKSDIKFHIFINDNTRTITILAILTHKDYC